VAMKAMNFVGRQEILNHLFDVVQYTFNNRTSNQPIAVIGTPGSGKSALMAKFARAYEDNHLYISTFFLF
jgi:Cdc6-like AAA superfamily ATPase